jgi:signal transduction histidine kinase
MDASGLMSALEALAKNTNEIQAAKCRFLCPKPVLLANNNMAIQLYRIAQEAITNALKHGQARHIDISLEVHDQTLTLKIQDDGIGIVTPPAKIDGRGMKIMRYRAHLINGTFTIDPAYPAGTIVCCSAPMPPVPLEPPGPTDKAA